MQDAAAWADARANPSEAAYQSYLDRFPNGANRADAQAQLTTLNATAEWQTLSVAGTADAVEDFVKRYPDLPVTEQARQRLAVLRRDEASAAWHPIQATEHPDVLQEHLDKFPDSPHADEAKQRLEVTQRIAANRARIQAEADAWSKVKDSTSATDIKAFLTDYPDGPNALNAKARLATLAAQKPRSGG